MSDELKKLIADGMHACQTGDCGHGRQYECEATLAQDSKPEGSGREFWIYEGPTRFKYADGTKSLGLAVYDRPIPHTPENKTFHVIEKSAVDKLQRDNDALLEKLANKHVEVYKRNAELQRDHAYGLEKNREMKAALEAKELREPSYRSKIRELRAMLEVSEAERNGAENAAVGSALLLATANEKLTQERNKAAGLLDALKEVDGHLEFFAHVEKRYKEVGKDKVSFDKCAEIRAAHAVAKKALSAYHGKPGEGEG